LPRWLIIVRRDKPELYEHLRESYADDSRVEVILDRRRPTRTGMPQEANLRRADRRIRERRALPNGDRRQAQRRQSLARPQYEFWVNEGFFMTRHIADTPSP
jgi:riboflavin biosynthesis pyrimidine reductase